MNVGFNENDIRPDRFAELTQQAIKEDVEFLLARKDRFVNVLCPACKCENNNIVFSKNGFDYTECENCSMLYIKNRPSVEVLSEFYPNSPHYKLFNDFIFPSSLEVRREKIFVPRVQKVLDYCTKYNIRKNKLIEIGTGFGLFCEEMAKTKEFKDIVGVEASNSLAKTCEEKGFRIYNGLLEELNIEEKFNFAVAFEVIEHIFDPKSFLKKIVDILEIDGCLMLSFPNYEGFDIDTLKENSGAIDHEHLNYFTAKSIALLLNDLGMELLEISTPGELDVDIVKKNIERNNLKVSKFVRQICDSEKLSEKFQGFLKDNNLSSNMIVVARKRG